jgi:hypothetical protein
VAENGVRNRFGNSFCGNELQVEVWLEKLALEPVAQSEVAQTVPDTFSLFNSKRV